MSVVIPCHNEEQGIKNVLAAMPGCVDEVIVVNNGSTDATGAVAERMGAKAVFEERRGYGCAYKRGLPASRGDIIATLDGDGQYPVSAIPLIVDYMLSNELDFVSASRFPLTNRKAMRLRNVVGNKIQTWTMNLLFGTSLKDSQSGMWVFRGNVLGCLRMTSDGMSFSEEIKIDAIRHKDVRFGECHIDYHERLGEPKLYPWRDGTKNMWFLLKRRLRP